MKKRTKTILVLIILLIIGIGAGLFINNKESFNIKKSSNYFNIRVGSTFNDKMRIKEEKNKFKLGDVVYYDIVSKKDFSKDSTISIVVKSKDGKNKIYSKELKTYNKKLEYPIQPIEVKNGGEYILQASYDGNIVEEKPFEVNK
ncbi:hypothetical protein [Clostridium drakei]|uniref:Uncharacterized protein n=1 Tax=Clostridium drakei TaxID=332101 RepID=A0A2U8DLP7_9CLOT|nr:hypothetical protein [Clostridium drakei]AWI03132.1 hypothetical protein B9W14_00955 [Clostridium drakei]